MQKGYFPASLHPLPKFGRCQEPECSARATVECCLPEGNPAGNYCAAHAIENGYCCGCGQFWAGISSFDFSKSGLCENCLSEMQDDEDIDDEHFPVRDWDPDGPDYSDVPLQTSNPDYQGPDDSLDDE